MENEPEVIRDQMQDTRTALTEKLEALEQTVAKTVENTTRPVVETVQSVTDATKETVGAVKNTVQQIAETVSGSVEKTVETVKDTFDLSRQVEQHPWAMMLGSMAAGYVVGRLLPPLSDARGTSTDAMTSRMSQAAEHPAREREHNGRHRRRSTEKKEEPAGKSWLGGLLDTYHDEVKALEGLGVAAVVGVARDLLTQNLKGEVGERLGEWMNGLTQKLGAQPLSEPVLAGGEKEETTATTGQRHSSRQGQPNGGRKQGR